MIGASESGKQTSANPHWLDRIGSVLRGRTVIYTLMIAVGIYAVFLRCIGMGKSLWLDEAWVANSVVTPSIRETFFYPAWLQSSPPLFLVLERISVALFGLSNIVARVVPWLMGIVALLSILLLGKRLLSRQFMLLAWAMLALSAAAVDFSKTLKHYSSELAAAAAIPFFCILYIENPTLRRFWLLLAATVTGLLVGYGIAFLLPGVFLITLISGRNAGSSNSTRSKSWSLFRPLLLTLVAGGTLIGEYLVFALPNSPDVFRTSWAKKNVGAGDFVHVEAKNAYHLISELPVNHRLQRQGLLLGAFGTIITVGFVLACLRSRKGRTKWLQIQIVCLLPCILLFVTDWLDRYPFSDRTSLFALPLVIIAVVTSLQLIYYFMLRRRRGALRSVLDAMILCAIIVTILAGRAKLPILKAPREDADGAIAFLRTHVQPADFLWVHSSCSEVFKLYSRIDRWTDAPVHYGNTGWPCCPRGIDVDHDSGESLVRDDFGKALPAGFRGKVWLLYTTRPGHWFNKPYEPQFMEAILRERGCVALSAPSFDNLGVDQFDCEPLSLP